MNEELSRMCVAYTCRLCVTQECNFGLDSRSLGLETISRRTFERSRSRGNLGRSHLGLKARSLGLISASDVKVSFYKLQIS